MLEAQLNAARQARRQRNIKIAVTAAIIIILGGAALALTTSCCGFGEREVVSVEETLPTVPADAAKPEGNTAPIDTAAREQYLQLLNAFQNELKPQLATIDLGRWQPQQQQRLSTLKDQALTAFTAMDYATALDHMQAATTLAESLIDDSGVQFGEAMTAAQTAYASDSYDEARLQVDRALMLNTGSDEARELAGKIDALGDILPLLQQAQVAKTENNAEKELALIEQILELAPARDKEQQRKQQLVNAISSNKFQYHLKQAYSAINKQDAGLAAQHINSAKRIYPNRSEINDAGAALQALEKQKRVASYSSQALAAMRADDWLTARQQLSLALSERPNDKTLRDLQDKTNNILSLGANIETHLANPYRLANTTTRAEATALLEQTEIYRPASPGLVRKATSLAELIQNMSKKVTVNVVSDNKTNVLVRGVGVIGQTESKTIELAPGQYKFEGKRTGYKSKLIDVLIPYDQPSIQLTVICDEPI